MPHKKKKSVQPAVKKNLTLLPKANAQAKEAKENLQVATGFYFQCDNSTLIETLLYVDGSISCNCEEYKAQADCSHIRLIMGGMGEQSAIKVVNFRPIQVLNPISPNSKPIERPAPIPFKPDRVKLVIKPPENKTSEETKRKRFFKL